MLTTFLSRQSRIKTWKMFVFSYFAKIAEIQISLRPLIICVARRRIWQFEYLALPNDFSYPCSYLSQTPRLKAPLLNIDSFAFCTTSEFCVVLLTSSCHIELAPNNNGYIVHQERFLAWLLSQPVHQSLARGSKASLRFAGQMCLPKWQRHSTPSQGYKQSLVSLLLV